MASTRRIGSEDSATRAALLDAAQRLMLEGGYAAVTSRRVAAEAGLKPQLVHYYFRTMDDLFLALFRRGAEFNLERQAEALASPTPLRALWDFSRNPAGTALTLEFAALANHRKAIRAELADFAERFRGRQAEALAGAFERAGIDADEVPHVVVLVMMAALTQVLAMEDGLGVSTGHPETLAVVDRWLDRLEPLEP
jgi:AcrR family transcriptional regulator